MGSSCSQTMMSGCNTGCTVEDDAQITHGILSRRSNSLNSTRLSKKVSKESNDNDHDPISTASKSKSNINMEPKRYVTEMTNM